MHAGSGLDHRGGVTPDDSPEEKTKKRKAAASQIRSNRQDHFINVKSKLYFKLYYYSCSHAATALALSAFLQTHCSEAMLGKVRAGTCSSACKKAITRSDVTDREKAEPHWVQTTEALEEAYAVSPAAKAIAEGNAKRLATFVARHGRKGRKSVVGSVMDESRADAPV